MYFYWKYPLVGDLSIGREEAFEIFKQRYHLNSQIQAQKEELKVKCTEAKRLGNIINTARETTSMYKISRNVNDMQYNSLDKIKSEISRIRIQHAISADPGQLNPNVSLAMTDDEMRLRNEMERENMQYKDAYINLKNLKTVIEHMQHLLETSKVKMMKDFEQWWQDEVTRLESQKNSSLMKVFIYSLLWLQMNFLICGSLDSWLLVLCGAMDEYRTDYNWCVHCRSSHIISARYNH